MKIQKPEMGIYVPTGRLGGKEANTVIRNMVSQKGLRMHAVPDTTKLERTSLEAAGSMITSLVDLSVTGELRLQYWKEKLGRRVLLLWDPNEKAVPPLEWLNLEDRDVVVSPPDRWPAAISDYVLSQTLLLMYGERTTTLLGDVTELGSQANLGQSTRGPLAGPHAVRAPHESRAAA